MKVFRNISAVKFMLFACMCLFYGCGGEKKTDATIARDEVINDLFDELKRDIATHITEHMPDETSALDILMIGKLHILFLSFRHI